MVGILDGDLYNDYPLLEERLTADMRLYGFTVCLDPDSQALTAFGVALSRGFGTGERQNLSLGGKLDGP